MRQIRAHLVLAMSIQSLLFAALPAVARPCDDDLMAAASRSFRSGDFDALLDQLGTKDDLYCFFRRTLERDVRTRRSYAGFADFLLAESRQARGKRALRLVESAELAARRSLDRGQGPGKTALLESLLLQISDHDRGYLSAEAEALTSDRQSPAGSETEGGHRTLEILGDLEALREALRRFRQAADQLAPSAIAPSAIDAEVHKPTKLEARPPQYTERARQARVQGTIVVQAIIDAEGQVDQVQVLRGQPLGLSGAAVEAISAWRFKPATRDGRPVPVYYNLTVNFRLQ